MTGQIGGTNHIATAEKQRKAVELRKAGLGYQEIADQIGYTHASAAYKAVRAALRALVKEPAEEVLALELARLDAMLAGIWLDARKGNVLKIDRALKIMQRRADLLGLDAPKRHEWVKEEAARLAEQTGLAAADILAEAEAIIAGAQA
jgi:arginyl-tRNA synthetase